MSPIMSIAPATNPPSAATAFLAGFRAAWLSVMAYVLIGTYIGLAALAHDFGFSLWWVMASTVLVWAGPAQVILVSALGAGANPVDTALAVSVSSARLMPMVVSLLPLLRRKGTPVASFCCRRISPRSACGSRRCGYCPGSRATAGSRSLTGSA